MSYQQRTLRLQSSLSPSTAIVLSKPADIQYFTGFVCLNPQEREAFLVVTSQSATLLYPTFSPVNKEKGIRYHAGYWPENLKEIIEEKKQKEAVSDCLIDTSSLFVSEFQVLSTLQDVTVKELDRTPIIQQRTTKDASEIAAITQASTITANALAVAVNSLAVGLTEQALTKKIEIALLSLGADTLAFPPVVAYGSHSALPHHQPTDTALAKEMVVLIDIGAKYHSYCSDMTRTVWFGKKPSAEFLKIEQSVKQAYDAGLAELHQNCHGDAVDKAVRTVIEDAGFGNNFIHTTGHGLGLEIHEQPSLYFKRSTVLPLHTAVTIEPGIYLEGKFGYRHENTAIVTKDGYKELTV